MDTLQRKLRSLQQNGNIPAHARDLMLEAANEIDRLLKLLEQKDAYNNNDIDGGSDVVSDE